MLLNVGMAFSLMREQALIDEHAWATRMIEHHSTAVTTSQALCRHCDRNATLCALACEMVTTQLDEIGIMQTQSNYTIVSTISSFIAVVLALPVAVVSYCAM